MLLDEPFAGLDPEVRAALLQDAERALRSPGRATLVVVHDRAEAWALADRLLILIEGRIVADGPPATLLSAPPSALVARFLGYDGELRDGDELLLTRAAHVTLDADGPYVATVARVIPLEDGVRLELTLADGRLYTVAQLPAPRVGDRLTVRIDGGVRFPHVTGGRRALPSHNDLPLTALSCSVHEPDTTELHPSGHDRDHRTAGRRSTAAKTACVTAASGCTCASAWSAATSAAATTLPSKHASAHARSTEHPIIRSLEPGEQWSWCFVDEVGMILPQVTGQTKIPPSPMLQGYS